MDRNTFIRRLLDRAAGAGIDGEACYERYESFRVSVKDGEILRYNVSDGMGLGFRALKDGRSGTASTQILDEDALDQLFCGATENAALVESADPQFLYPGADAYPELRLYNPEIDAMPASAKIDMARRLERLALERDPRIRRVEDCVLFSSSQEFALVNTLGLDVSTRVSLIGGYVCVVAQEGDRVNTGSKSFFCMNPADIDLADVAGAAAREALDGLDGAPVDSGKYRVLLRNDVSATLLSTFSGIFSADNAQRGMSRLKGREGTAVAAACVTLMDDPHREDSASSAPFDGEGVPTRPKAVIDGGRLTTLLHNIKTARKQGVKTTANASRAGCAAPVGIAPSNFFFAPSDESFDALAHRCFDGLLITELQGMHAGANAVTGDFSLAAKGFRIENGRVTAPVNQITVAGNYYDLLMEIEAVGGDLEFRAPGNSCFGSPSLLVRSLSVAGKK